MPKEERGSATVCQQIRNKPYFSDVAIDEDKKEEEKEEEEQEEEEEDGFIHLSRGKQLCVSFLLKLRKLRYSSPSLVL